MGSSQSCEPGDLIEVSRGLFNHWGVYVGDGKVVHFGALGHVGSGTSMSDVDGMVKKDSIEKVVKDDSWSVNNTKHLLKPRPAADIVRDALAEVGRRKQYNLTSYNCEHFATEMRYGRAVSTQVDNVVGLGVGAVGLAVGTGAAAIMGARSHHFHM